MLAQEIGVGVHDLVKLDANENLYNPALEEIREAIANADLHIYPDPGQTALREAIAEYLDVDASQVVAGSGADDLIDILIRLTMPQAVATATPTFGMYSFLAKISVVGFIEDPAPRFPASTFARSRGRSRMRARASSSLPRRTIQPGTLSRARTCARFARSTP